MACTMACGDGAFAGGVTYRVKRVRRHARSCDAVEPPARLGAGTTARATRARRRPARSSLYEPYVDFEKGAAAAVTGGV